MKAKKQFKWHVWFTERLFANGWAPNFRYERASGTKAEALEKVKQLKQIFPDNKFRVTKFVSVR